ncbi:MAG: hypothetical protein QXY74_06100 [Candidatus Bathyarchaeia archaeon]
MPYIKPERRPELDKIIEQILIFMQKLPEQERDGCLNYLFTKTLKTLFKPSYFNYERIMGLLTCIQQEFYRRWISPYEDSKMKEHGDV